MKIANETKHTILANDVIIADTFLKRIKGLLGKKSIRQDEALILRPCNCVHTFFMRFTIGCLFVDKNKKVVKLISHLKPFRITPTCFPSSLVIELSPEAIESSATQEGDTLVF